MAHNQPKLNPAYLIAGHGGESRGRTFIVPKGCTIVVHKHPYELSYEYDHMFRALLQLPKMVIANPVEHKYKLIEKLGSLAIYTEGDICPYFTYNTLSCFPTDGIYTTCSGNRGSGVNDIMKMKDEIDKNKNSTKYYKSRSGIVIQYETLLLKSDVLNSLDPYEIIEILSDMYRFSVYPNKDWIFNLMYTTMVDLVYSKQSGKNYNNTEMIQHLLEVTSSKNELNPTQVELCDAFPGVYYNFVCRYTSGTYNINQYNSNLQKVQPIYNSIIQTPFMIKSLLKNRISETELKRKSDIRNFYENPKYLSNKEEKLDKLIQQYKKISNISAKKGTRIPPMSKNLYETLISPLSIDINYRKASSKHNNSTYKKVKNANRVRWVKNGGTRKKKS